MKNNNTVDTAQKGQTANKIQPEKVQNNLKKIQEIKNAKKDKTPTGKVIVISEKESTRKAREEQYRNFRINALKRRAGRMGLSEEKIEEAVKKLIEQMDAPKEYNILIMVAKATRKKDKPDITMLKEALAKEGIKYAFCGDDFVSVNGNQDVLAKIREIAPPSAKIYPYAKKMESVLPKKEYTGIKKPSNNSKEKALTAKIARKEKKIRIHRNKKTGEIEHRKISKRPNRHSNPTKKYTKKIVLKTLAKAKKRNSSIVVQMPTKKASEGSKTLKKAA